MIINLVELEATHSLLSLRHFVRHGRPLWYQETASGVFSVSQILCQDITTTEDTYSTMFSCISNPSLQADAAGEAGLPRVDLVYS